MKTSYFETFSYPKPKTPEDVAKLKAEAAKWDAMTEEEQVFEMTGEKP